MLYDTEEGCSVVFMEEPIFLKHVQLLSIRIMDLGTTRIRLVTVQRRQLKKRFVPFAQANNITVKSHGVKKNVT